MDPEIIYDLIELAKGYLGVLLLSSLFWTGVIIG
jgi:hypothetical protein